MPELSVKIGPSQFTLTWSCGASIIMSPGQRLMVGCSTSVGKIALYNVVKFWKYAFPIYKSAEGGGRGGVYLGTARQDKTIQDNVLFGLIDWLISGASDCLAFLKVKLCLLTFPYLNQTAASVYCVKFLLFFFHCPCPFIVWSTGWKFQINPLISSPFFHIYKGDLSVKQVGLPLFLAFLTEQAKEWTI